MDSTAHATTRTRTHTNVPTLARGTSRLVALLACAVAAVAPVAAPAHAAGLVTLSASRVDLGSVTVGETSGTRTVSLTNPGLLPLRLGDVDVTTSDPAFRPDAGSCGDTLLASGATCEVAFTFSPDRTGDRRATGTVDLQVLGLDLVTLSVDLRGRGVAPEVDDAPPPPTPRPDPPPPPDPEPAPEPAPEPEPKPEPAPEPEPEPEPRPAPEPGPEPWRPSAPAPDPDPGPGPGSGDASGTAGPETDPVPSPDGTAGPEPGSRPSTTTGATGGPVDDAVGRAAGVTSEPRPGSGSEPVAGGGKPSDEGPTPTGPSGATTSATAEPGRAGPTPADPRPTAPSTPVDGEAADAGPTNGVATAAAPVDDATWASRWPRLGHTDGPGPVEVVLGGAAVAALLGYLVALLRGRRVRRGPPRGIPARVVDDDGSSAAG